mmetsp:Transcript_14171/g.14701  ORF Transcript_14171/g.14701 Transcript_14171/m.14701 type:complete len:203 (-) Transcript_14171:764-1372(-)
MFFYLLYFLQFHLLIEGTYYIRTRTQLLPNNRQRTLEAILYSFIQSPTHSSIIQMHRVSSHPFPTNHLRREQRVALPNTIHMLEVRVIFLQYKRVDISNIIRFVTSFSSLELKRTVLYIGDLDFIGTVPDCINNNLRFLNFALELFVCVNLSHGHSSLHSSPIVLEYLLCVSSYSYKRVNSSFGIQALVVIGGVVVSIGFFN